MYRERRSRIDGAAVWSRLIPAGGAVHRILPDGCLDLIWHDGDLLVAGPDTRAVVLSSPAGTGYTGIRFPPGVGPAVLGVPADEVRDRRIRLAALWPATAARRATDLVTGAEHRGVALEDLALTRLAAHPPDEMARRVAARLAEGAPVAEVAAEVGLSDRQLRRRAVHAYGYPPKTLARILRLQRVLALARAEPSPLAGGGSRRDAAPLGSTGAAGAARGAALAAAAGYADQAHLSREVKALAGVPLRDLR